MTQGRLWPAIAAAAIWFAPAAPGQTVEGMYRGLSSGPLRAAKLADLPGDLVLQAGGVRITAKEIATEMDRADASVRAQVKKNGFLVLERKATRLLLSAEATAWARRTGSPTRSEPEDDRIRAYLSSAAASAKVTDAEARSFYAANRDMMGGAPYESVAADLKTYLLNQKRAEAVQRHIDGLSARVAVTVDAPWCRTQATLALDNPVDKARRSGKPALIDFGAKGCGPCDRMAPILEELAKSLAGKCIVHFVPVRDEWALGDRYGIRGIPAQVFFDRQGNEVYRHVGFLSKERILAKLAELGVR